MNEGQEPNEGQDPSRRGPAGEPAAEGRSPGDASARQGGEGRPEEAAPEAGSRSEAASGQRPAAGAGPAGEAGTGSGSAPETGGEPDRGSDAEGVEAVGAAEADEADEADAADEAGEADEGPAPGRPPRARLGAASGILTAIVIAGLVILNVLGTRINHTIDLTANHAYTLSSATLKVLGELKKPVQIYGFLQSGSSAASEIRSLLSEYRRAGGSKVHVQVVDPASQPALAQRYGVVEYNDVVVVSGTGHATATPANIFSTDPATGSPVFNGEAAITNAILRAANPQHLAVYFLAGHNEQQTGPSYSLVQEALTGGGYTVQNLDLLTQTAVPKNAAAVIVAGPQHDLAPAEVTALQKYAAGGGHLFVMLDPLLSGPLTRLDGLLHSLGVSVRNDLVVDPAANRHFQTQPVTLVPRVDPQSITNPLVQANVPVLIPDSVSMAPVTGNKAQQVKPLLQTSSSSYAKTDLHATSLNFNPKTDVKGPLDVGVAVTSTVKGDGFKMVVLGSSTFALDSFFNTIPGNHDLFLNAVSWLTGQTAGIRIRPIKALQNTVVLTSGAMRGLFYGYVVLLPVLALVGAVVVWSWRRRL